VGMIHRSGLHLLSLINEVLDLSKIETGGVKVNLGLFDPVDTVIEVADTLRPLARAKGLELHVEVPPSEFTLMSDAEKIRQILLNIGGNAVKFTNSGSVVLKLEHRVHDLRFMVTDTGLGIPAGELAHIFEAFTQVDRVREVKPEGTGLGLSISRRYAELLGGKILVESEPGVGSTFTLIIPMR